MTDNRHSNAVLVGHVTIDFEWFHSSLSIRVDEVRTIWEITKFDLTAGFISLGTKKKTIDTAVFLRLCVLNTGKTIFDAIDNYHKL